MKKVILFISILLLSINVYAQELSIECPSEAKVNDKVDCKVKLSTIEDVTEVSFNISNTFEVNVIPLWSHVESGGVHTFTKEGSESTTLATLSFTPKIRPVPVSSKSWYTSSASRQVVTRRRMFFQSCGICSGSINRLRIGKKICKCHAK